MCCAGNNRRAFTLLEVVISVAVLAMIAITIYRFVETNLRAIQISSEQSTDEMQMRALFAALQTQLSNLPTGEPGVLLGTPHVFSDKASDELQLLCYAGNGLFTQFADGQYKVTLVLKPVPKTETCDLGLRRTRNDNSETDQHWLPLLGQIDALELRYYDQRLNAWVEKWTDMQARPALVRMRVWRAGSDAPFEAVLALPQTRLPS